MTQNELSQALPRAPSSTQETTVSSSPVLTIQTGGSSRNEEQRVNLAWHELDVAYRYNKILTGKLVGVEEQQTGKAWAIIDYKGIRVVIPLSEMNVLVDTTGQSKRKIPDLPQRKARILSGMLGSEIDFIVRGIDMRSQSVVASRKDAMLKKQQMYYLEPTKTGLPHIFPDRPVEARVTTVMEKAICVEVFGVECFIRSKDLSWEWIADAREKYSVGDIVQVHVKTVVGTVPGNIQISADVRSLTQNTKRESLKKVREQSRYAGTVTDVHNGNVYIHLANGVNAVAHSCMDSRMPGKKDEVSFAVTKLDEEKGIAIGIITRIIRQNL